MTLEKLKEIKERTSKDLSIRLAKSGYKVYVVAGKTGIEHGSREILSTILDEVALLGIKDCVVTQIGTIGNQEYEPLVEVVSPDGKDYIYGSVTKEIAKQIVVDHVSGNKVVTSALLENVKEA